MFGRERTSFLIVLRHPLSALTAATAPHVRLLDCGRSFLKGWLDTRRRLFLEDIPHLRNVAVIHYEQLMEGDIRRKR
jgi:hypothetical protein